MNRSHVCVAITVSLLCLAVRAQDAFAAVPGIINIQGILRDATDIPLPDATYDVTFRIYDAASGGTVLWSESAPVTTLNGLFTALMGSGVPVPDSIFNNPDLWLGIQVTGYPEMSPRVRLSSVGYAFEAEQWATIGPNLYRLSGDVGIGTSEPHSKFDVRGDVEVTGDGANPDTKAYATFGVTRNNDPSHKSYIGMTKQGHVAWGLGISSESDLILGLAAGPSQTIPTPHMAIEPLSGYVGIGTLDPLRPLHATGAGLFTARFENSHATAAVVEFQNASSGAVWEIGVSGSSPPFAAGRGSMYLYRQGTSTAPLIIDSSGWIAVHRGLGLYGTSGLWVYGGGIYVNGGAQMNNGLTVYGGIYGAGGCQVQWSCPSDIRLKENIEPIDDALRVIGQLQGVRYDWRRNDYPERGFSETRQLGLIAQDVQSAAPEVLTQDKEGYWGVDYERLVPLLIEGIKEQQKQIEMQQDQIEQLKKILEQ